MNDKTPIVDAVKPLRIAVTHDDIALAVQRDDGKCALAQAVTRRHGVEAVSIGATIALVRYNKRTVRYSLSKHDAAIIRAFDDSGAFPTVTVTLQPPIRRYGSRKGEAHGSDVRSGNGGTVHQHVHRPPSRHVRDV